MIATEYRRTDIMTPGRQAFIVAIFLIFATVLQGIVAHAIMIKGAEPDFTLIVLACGATLIGGNYSVALAVWAGLLDASMLAQYIGSYLASRTLAGAFAGGLKSSVIRDSLVVPPLIVFLTTAVAHLIFAAMVPHAWLHRAHQWSHEVLGQIIYNTILSYPVYFLLRRCHVGQPKENPFGRIP
jgi:rod shape-determining protein MreD